MINSNENHIVIIGRSATGKTTLSNQLYSQYPTYNLYHTDDYIDYGWDISLQALMREINADLNPRKIIEGIQAVRLLRKGIELGTFSADLIIITDTSHEKRLTRYQQRGEIKNLTKFDKLIHDIWADYIDKVINTPRIIKITT